jgi:hypothetical protein
MKRSLMLCLGLFAAAVGLPADMLGQVSIGVGGGISAATWGGSDADDFSGAGIDKSSRKGLRVGGYVLFPVSGRVSIAPGVSFIQKGVTYSDGTDDLNFKSNYLEFPILLSISVVGPESPVGFSLNAGPTLAFEAGCDVEATSGGASVSDDCDSFGFNERQSLDVGAMFSAAVSFPVGESFSIVVSGAADFGLRTLDTSTDPDDFKNQAFYGSVFALFPIGG